MTRQGTYGFILAGVAIFVGWLWYLNKKENQSNYEDKTTLKIS